MPEIPYNPSPSDPNGPPFHVVQVTVLVNGVPTVLSMEAIAVADEYGNLLPLSAEEAPWKQALLDEMRAIRLGIQTIMEYLSPAAGISVPSIAQGPVTHLGSSGVGEVDLLELAQSIREGSPEVD